MFESVVAYLPVLALVLFLGSLRDQSAFARKVINTCLAVLLLWPLPIGILYICRDHWLDDYVPDIYAGLLTAVVGAVVSLLLLLWFVVVSGLWGRRFRSSLRTLLLLALSAAGIVGACLGSFWYPYLCLGGIFLSALTWSVLQDRRTCCGRKSEAT